MLKRKAGAAILLAGFVISSMPLLASEQVFTLDIDEWARPRNGEAIVQFSALNQLMTIWSQQEKAVIEIRYPGGDEGSLWAGELADWLIALGIPSAQIKTVSGSASIDKIELLIISDGIAF